MLQKKICLLGAFAVGKTSLIMRYVDSIFSDKYHTSVGVKIDKKQLTVDEQDVTLMIWDLAGQDDLTRLRTSYLRGAAGYIVVADGTRPFSLETAINMHKEAREYTGDVPFILALNKSDLQEDGKWKVDPEKIAILEKEGAEIVLTSAKDNENVEAIFQKLTKKILENQSNSSLSSNSVDKL